MVLDISLEGGIHILISPIDGCCSRINLMERLRVQV